MDTIYNNYFYLESGSFSIISHGFNDLTYIAGITAFRNLPRSSGTPCTNVPLHVPEASYVVPFEVEFNYHLFFYFYAEFSLVQLKSTKHQS